jgi:predicted ATPase/class 3 adenylate cyclase
VTFRPVPGNKIGPYDVVMELARGGMAQVLLARDQQLGRDVALKLLSPELSEDPGFRTRFLREARVAAALEHPNVVPVYDSGEFEGLLYIVMRYVPGPDLREVLKKGPLEPERALHILGQVAAALDAAHQAGLVHRDVKPGNVLLVEPATPGQSEHAYLTDFGLVWRPVAADERTDPGGLLGTPNYAAPEQLQGKPVDGRADVYALGSVLYACLTGQPPFPRDSTLAAVAAHLHEPPPRPTQLRPELPAAMDAIIVQAMAKEREDRPRTCTELIRAAREALRGGISPGVVVPARVGGLPLPLTSFVGRDPDMRRIEQAIDGSRVVTLLGIGGAGKSRLAVEVARRQAQIPDAIYLDVGTTPTGGVAAAIQTALASTPSDAAVLLLLDECERRIGELADVLTGLLAARPEARVLATSREPLSVPGEVTIQVPPLPCPEHTNDLGVLATAAGRLFWDRATAADPDLEADSQTLRLVARICRSLDGIPLALELAASRARSLPLERIATQAAASPTDISATAGRSRHQSLASVIDGTYSLLDAEARELFCALSVFAAPFGLGDIEAVCGGDADLVDSLGVLVDRSLVIVQRAGRRTRYRLLTPLARFAADRLADSGDELRVRRQHALHYFTPLVAGGETLGSAASAEAHRSLDWATRTQVDAQVQRLAGQAAVVLGEWDTAVDLLDPVADDDPVVLEALGVALCKASSTTPDNVTYRRGQGLLERSISLEPRASVLAALAGSWKGTDDVLARSLYQQALVLDPTDTYALGNVLEYEILASGSLAPVDDRRDQLRVAIQHCRHQAAEGANLPWAYYDQGKLLALISEELPAATALLEAVRSSANRHPLTTTLRSLRRIADVAGPAHPVTTATAVLELLARSRSRDAHETEPTTRTLGLQSPVLVLAGDSATPLHRATTERSADVVSALAGFRGSVVSGGTTTGISALAGDVGAALPEVQVVGYTPAFPPDDAAFEHDLRRYRQIRRTDTTNRFGPAEPLLYWTDVLDSNIPPSQVCVLGIGGGELAAFEYRLALTLGGYVGVLRESGREGSELLAAASWSESDRLFEVPADVDGIRRFLRRCAVLPDELTKPATPGTTEHAGPRRAPGGRSGRVLATILFTDIVGSTELAARLGDAAWRDLLQRHHAIVRTELTRFEGDELDTAGDGFFVTFDGPAPAVRAAAAIGDALAPLDLEIRAGVHTGEFEVADEKLAGIAVSVGARISALAAPGEVLVSSTVKDLVAGSGLHFEDRGEHQLKGVPDVWHLYALVR